MTRRRLLGALIYTAVALVYFVMIFPFTWLSRGVERRLTYA